MPSAPPALPGAEPRDPALQAILDGQQALLMGMNELRTNVVTRQNLAELYKLQRDELQTFVAAETEQLHSGLGQVAGEMQKIAQDTVRNSERVEQLEAQVKSLKGEMATRRSKSEGPVRNKFDPASRQISFLGFPEGLSRTLCRREMDNFAEKNFPDYKPIFSEVRFKGEYGKRAPGRNGYLEFSSKDVRDAALKALGKNAILKISGIEVAVKPAKTQEDWLRDDELREIGKLVKEHPSARGKSVETLLRKDRCVKVEGIVIYEQPKRGSKEPGKFADAFADLAVTA